MDWAQAFTRFLLHQLTTSNIVYYNLLTGLKLVILPSGLLLNIKNHVILCQEPVRYFKKFHDS